MGLSPRLEMRAGQQLVMTPQLQQAIRLLQYSNLELAAFVETELERNPLLEHDSADDRRDQAAEPVAEVADGSRDDSALEVMEFGASTAAAEDAVDSDVGSLFPDATPTELANGDMGGAPGAQSSGWETMTSRNGAQEGDGNALEDQVSEQVSLKDHLLAQAGLVLPDRVDYLIGTHIVDLVDEAGYIDGDLVSLAPRARPQRAARLRADGRVRPVAGRVPETAADRKRSLRSDHGAVG
jgi:RNA polymerase sigma-54 factor